MDLRAQKIEHVGRAGHACLLQKPVGESMSSKMTVTTQD